MGAFIKKCRTSQMNEETEWSVFMLGVMKSGEWWKGMIGQKVWASVVNRETARSVQIPLCYLVLRDKDVFILQV